MLRKVTVAFAFLVAATAAHAEGDPKAGVEVFKKCAMCHTVEKGGSNSTGPNLFAVVGRKAAALPGFQYSGKLKESGIVWTPENLAKWVMRPGVMVPGTKMSFSGIPSKTQQADVVAYLQTLK